MTNNKTVLLLVDQKARDVQGILLVSYYLGKMGCDVYICNKRNMIQKYDWCKPKVVAFSDTSTYFANWCRYMSSKSHIVLIPQEGGIPIRKIAIKRYTWPDNNNTRPFTEGVSKVFLWGSQTARWLLEENIFRQDQIVVSGTPRFDQYRCIQEKKHNNKKNTYTIGIANRGEAINMIYDTVVHGIFKCKEYNGPLEAYIGNNRNWEDWIWHTVAQLRYYYILIDRMSHDQNINKILFRPDPFENYTSYNFLKKIFQSVEINRNPFLGEFINDIDMLITEYSTVGVDALLCGKPVISVQGMIGSRLYEHIGDTAHVDTSEIIKLFWLPKTVDEAIILVEKGCEGVLPVCPDKQILNKYLSDFYDLPRHEPSSLTIAREIATLLDIDINASEIDTDDYLKYFPTMQKLSVILPFLDLNSIKWLYKQYYMFDIFNILRDSSAIRSEHYPWHFRDYRKAKAIYKQLNHEE